jgi:hypothetical protein
VKFCLSIHDVDPPSWQNFRTVKEWWMEALHKKGQSNKGTLTSFDVDISGNLERKKRSHLSKCLFTSTMIISTSKMKFPFGV